MPLLLAEVMDKVAEGFDAVVAGAAFLAPPAFALGRWAPRLLAGAALGLVGLAATWPLAREVRDPFDHVRACAWAEAGARGVVQDVASAHLWWVTPALGLLAGLGARSVPSRAARLAPLPETGGHRDTLPSVVCARPANRDAPGVPTDFVGHASIEC